MILGGTNEKEIGRCMLNSHNVLRIVLSNSDGSKILELWTSHDKNWKTVTEDQAALLMRIFGWRVIELLDRFKPFTEK